MPDPEFSGSGGNNPAEVHGYHFHTEVSCREFGICGIMARVDLFRVRIPGCRYRSDYGNFVQNFENPLIEAIFGRLTH